MKHLVRKARTVLRLGIRSVLRFAWYRLGVRVGWNPVKRLQANVPQGPYFGPVLEKPVAVAHPCQAWREAGYLFSRWPIAIGDAPPDWFADPLSGKEMAHVDRNWWEIPDFAPDFGDIKVLWELSRMDWALAFAQQARSGSDAALERLNHWLQDWCVRNRPYLGPNWKCGQEASIRVINVAAVALILGQVTSCTAGLRELLRVHLSRISPTIQYALAQDNNHGTSEAAALFIGGSWLEALGAPEGKAWSAKGLRWLENRAATLIEDDGTFSQYSLNYHRLMLDTLSFAEVWRQHLGLQAFSGRFYARALAATEWLYQMVDVVSGDGPNVGANDGARLFPLTDAPYRDFRPCVQLAMVLFGGVRAYGEGPWDNSLKWFGVDVPATGATEPGSFVADKGGFGVLRNGTAMALLRYPRFRFRPSHADALHVDLWVGGENVLRDGGSFSYNTDEASSRYFSGVESHNTVQFDGHDQMPRVSRFLFGDWVKATNVEPLVPSEGGVSFGASYRDGDGCTHHRQVFLRENSMLVVDEVKGFRERAVARWRLVGDWRMEGGTVTDGRRHIAIEATAPVSRQELVEGWESRHYLEKTPLTVLEVEVRQAGIIRTELRWKH